MGLRSHGLAAAVAVTTTALATPTAAQTVVGELVDRGSGEPIAGAYVALLSEYQDTIVETLSDRGGRFVLRPPTGAGLIVQISAFGYRTVTDGVFDVGEVDTLRIDARLSLEPISIAGVEVSTSGRRSQLVNAGFYRRMDAGWGRFMTPEEITLRAPTSATDLFVGIPSVQLTPDRNGLSATLAVRVGGRICYPSVFIDNLVVYRGQFATGGGARLNDGDRALTLGTGQTLDLNALLDVNSIEAIELYTGPAEVPERFNVLGSGCGVLVIWTRTGRR